MNDKSSKIKEIFNLAVKNYQNNNLQEAENLYKKILEINPDHFESIFDLGTLLAQVKNFTNAKKLLTKATLINPKYADAHNNLGIVFKELNELEEAKNCFRQALKIDPHYAAALYNLGIVLKELGEFEESIDCYKKVIEIDPYYLDAYNNLGNALRGLEKFNEAKEIFQKAINIKPDYALAHNNLGIVYKELVMIKEALSSFQKSVSIDPTFLDAHNNLLFTLLYFENDNPNHYLSQAKKFKQSIKPINDNLLLNYKFEKKPKKLKIGFVSGDLREHPIGFFLLDLIKYLKEKNLDLIAYSNSKIKDNISEKLNISFKQWNDVVDLDDLDLVNQIRNDGIHILFDLSGHSLNNRLPIFLNKPAPVQVTWAGFLASTGISEIDYIIGDPYVTPREDAKYFEEKIFSLPNIWCCFSKPEFDVQIKETPAIKNGFITFGSFNNLSKVSHDVIKLWSDVLNQVPKSKILLKAVQLNDLDLKEEIIKKFEENNINSNLILLEGSSSREELLNTYNNIDISLDTFPYSGGTTSFESIWMGTPILTKKGIKFVSRSTESINHNVGMSDWVAKDDKDYIERAVKFTRNFEKINEIKMNLRKLALKSSLFNSLLFAEQFDKALWKMWDNFNNKK